MKAGDTFRPARRDIDIHLWVIVSDPEKSPARVLIVSMTTYTATKESVCLLDVGDHPFIHHKTCIAYNLAKAPSLAQLERARDAGELIPGDPVSNVILERIRAGASLSTKLSIEHFDILDEQGLV